MSKRTKATAYSNEDEDLETITNALHTKTPAGQQLSKAFFDRFGKEIQDARRVGGAGNKKCHYDFEIQVDGVWYTVEHKGSWKYEPIDRSQPPWVQGVQFYNGIADRYSLGRRYAQEWYTKYIASGHLSRKYQIKASIPSYEVWLKRDAMMCGDPKTPFGIELRSRFRGDGKTGGCYDERDEMRKTFAISDEEIEVIKKEVLTLAQGVLAQKKFWLQIQGNLKEKFYCDWHPELKLTTITKVEKDERCSDLQLRFHCDMGFQIKAMLRWGKGQGLSNIRIDLR